jgi:polar amino acid transport system substrate-binding protein
MRTVTAEIGWVALVLALLAAGPAAGADPAAVRQELVPTGRLRAAIAVGPAPSGLWALQDATTGAYRGVTVELARELARKLGVPVEWVVHRSSGEIQASAGAGAWDVTFMPVDDERRKVLDFGSPYHLLQSTYLVAPGSTIRTLADANRAGVCIAGVKDTATFRASSRASPEAIHVALASPVEAVALMTAGQADAIALSRASLSGLVGRITGSRILEGGFLNSTTAVAVPRGRPAALAYVSEVVEEAKASGLVRRAFDAVGLPDEQVAPAGMKP